jgi:hypothetical protein
MSAECEHCGDPHIGSSGYLCDRCEGIVLQAEIEEELSGMSVCEHCDCTNIGKSGCLCNDCEDVFLKDKITGKKYLNEDGSKREQQLAERITYRQLLEHMLNGDFDLDQFVTATDCWTGEKVPVLRAEDNTIIVNP